MAKPKIFVSHSSPDKPFASQLVDDLNSAGAQALMDMNDLDLGSVNYLQRLSDAIEDCEWFVLVLTQSAIESRWVRMEVEAAIRLKIQRKIKELIFVRAAPIDHGTLPAMWGVFNILDATRDYNSALSKLLKLIGLEKPTTPQMVQNLPNEYTSQFGDAIYNFNPTNRIVVSSFGALASKKSGQVFISYRRDDSAAGYAGRLCADLSQRYGKGNVFMDIDIEAGVDFVNTLEEAVGSCRILLAVIGRYWLTATDTGTGERRLDNPEDWVRVEIATALERNIRVIPILFHRATMPSAKDLPDNLKPLARRQAHEITDSRWDYDVGKLVKVVDKIIDFKEEVSQ